MPAAAVIPAPIAYIKVVAVKKLVVRVPFRTGRGGYRPVLARQLLDSSSSLVLRQGALRRVSCAAGTFTLNK